MAKFFGPGLSILSRIYPLTATGRQNVDRIDLESPISLVHDVSRESELHSSQKPFGGLFQVFLTLTHAGADVQEGTYSPFEVGVTGSPDPVLDETEWAWLLRIGQQAEAATNPSYWGVSVALAATLGVFQGGDFPIVRSTAAEEVGFNESVSLFVQTDITGVTGGRWEGKLPFPLVKSSSDSSRVRVISQSAAAGGNRFNFLFWRGKVGVMPPGMR